MIVFRLALIFSGSGFILTIADTLCCRAVSKYLQTLFVREPVQGRKVLALDHLLVGKTRKEASRMFFETLVCRSKF